MKKSFLWHMYSPKRMLIRFFLLALWSSFLIYSWWGSLSFSDDKKIIFLLDNSLSMSVIDIENPEKNIKIPRLDAAKNIIKNFVENSNFPFALATFSRNITLELPISRDASTFQNHLHAISPHIYGGGSDIFSALESLTRIYEHEKNLIIFIFTDGEVFNFPEKNFEKNSEHTLIFVGIGTKDGGPMVMGYDSSGNPEYRLFQGEKAISRFNENTFQNLKKYFSADGIILSSENELQKTLDFMSNIHLSKKDFDVWFVFGNFLLFIAIFINIFPYEKSYKK